MNNRSSMSAFAGLALAFVGTVTVAMAADPPTRKTDAARGKYIVEIGGCNDCHTPGFAMSGGTVPESEWLTGDALGWQGPWGTTYAPNLRLYMKDMTEAQAQAAVAETR